MPTPAPQSLVCGDVPEKHGFVAADTDEAVVVLRNADVVDFVAVGAVFLDFEAGGRVEEADVSVGAAGQELWQRSSDVGSGVVDVVEYGTYVLAGSGAVAESEHLACSMRALA